MERHILEQLDEKILGDDYFHNILYDKCHQLDVFFKRNFDLFYIFAGANFNLSKAADKELNLDEWDTNGPETLRMFLRAEHLKNAILSYNSVEDYVMKIIIFVFDLKGKKIKGKKDFRNKCKDIYYKDVLNLVIKSGCNKDVLEVMKLYHKNSDVQRLRKLANDIKHNNNIRFNGMPKPSYIEYSKVKNKSKITYSSEWTEPRTEDIECIIDMCYRMNITIKKYVEDIYNIVANKYDLNRI